MALYGLVMKALNDAETKLTEAIRVSKEKKSLPLLKKKKEETRYHHYCLRRHLLLLRRRRLLLLPAAAHRLLLRTTKKAKRRRGLPERLWGMWTWIWMQMRMRHRRRRQKKLTKLGHKSLLLLPRLGHRKAGPDFRLLLLLLLLSYQ